MWILIIGLACCFLITVTHGCITPVHDGGSQSIPLPSKLPDHPRFLLNQQEIETIREAMKTDDWTASIVADLVKSAEDWKPERLKEIKSGTQHQEFTPIARDLALAYQLKGERRWAESAAQIILAYADLAVTLEATPMAGLLSDSALREAAPIVDLCWAYDLIIPSGVLTTEQRRHIEDDLFKRVGRVAGHGCRHWNSSNWRARAIVTLAATGFVTGDRSLISEAVNGVYEPQFPAYLYGFAQHIAHAIRSDGTYWETTYGYTTFTINSMATVAEIARHSGVNLWTAQVPRLRQLPTGAWQHDVGEAGPGAFHYALDALIYRTFPNMMVSRTANSGHKAIENTGYIFDMLYKQMPDPRYAWIIWYDRRKRNADSKDPQLRSKDPLALALAVRDLPLGRFSFTDNADIGISGRHRNGCTLLPDGCYVIMRGDNDDVQATAFETHYGENVNAHEHADRLSVTLYGLNRILAPDAGCGGYSAEVNLNWMRQTLAHNTVTINETSQYPQENHDSVWVCKAVTRSAKGKLVFFHAGENFKAVRMTNDNVYPGTKLDRTLILLNPFVIDVYRVSCDKPSQIDWSWHGFGKAVSKTKLTPQPEPFSDRKGYMHLTKPAQDTSGNDWDITWTIGKQHMRMFQLGADKTTHLLAQTPSCDEDESRMGAISRRHGKKTIFISVIEPFSEESQLVSLKQLKESPDGTLTLELTHTNGTEIVVIPVKPGKSQLQCGDVSGQGFAAWCRKASDGRVTDSDIAEYEKPDQLQK